jgi:hypothetical protein
MGGLNMTQRQIRTWALSLLVAVGLFGAPGFAASQDLSNPTDQAEETQVVALSPTSRTFGTATQTAHVILGSDLDPATSTATWGYTGLSPTKFSNQLMYAGVRLPAGALVNMVELEGCDASNAAEITFKLQQSGIDVTPTGGSGVLATPGCRFF